MTSTEINDMLSGCSLFPTVTKFRPKGQFWNKIGFGEVLIPIRLFGYESVPGERVQRCQLALNLNANATLQIDLPKF